MNKFIGPTYNFDDVLIVPQKSSINSRKDVNLERTFIFKFSPRILTCIPIISANMSCVSGFLMSECLQQYKMITCLHKYYSAEELTKHFLRKDINLDYTWISIGLIDDEFQRILKFKKLSGLQPNICIDVPNAYIESFPRYCEKIRNEFPESIILAGNITTSDIVEEIIKSGVDCCKIQIGPGQQCNTRLMTGIGYGTISTILECSKKAHEIGALVCSDGGIKNPGDCCKGFCAGADFMMLGSYFNGFDENSDVCEWQYNQDGSKYMISYGMSSHYAQEKHTGVIKEYRASEGKISKVPYKGSIRPAIQELLGGIRSCCTYINALNIKEMSEKSVFCI